MVDHYTHFIFKQKQGETIKYNFQNVETQNIIKEKPFISSQKPRPSTNHALNLKSRDPDKIVFPQGYRLRVLILTKNFHMWTDKIKN